jgi:single-stranded-DNA-specific exonuclease
VGVAYARPPPLGAWLPFASLHPLVEYDPYALPDMEAAEKRIRLALAAGERIAVYGDFDCDGLTATALLVQTLKALGGDPVVVIPTRLDGHGLQWEQLRALAEGGVTLVISADCGISASDEVAMAQTQGLDVIITDHHTPPSNGSLPNCPVVSPSRPDSRYPFPYLCGVGVAYKLAQVLLANEECSRELLDLVVLGTLADVVPLRDENRSFVLQGLDHLRSTERPGLRALFAVAGIEPTQVTPTAVAFYLAPRINAANRMADPHLAYDLITARDSVTAARLANELNTHNRLRQELVSEHLEPLLASLGSSAELVQAVRDGRRPPLLFVEGTWPSGISGLLASKLAEAYGLPTVVVAQQEGEVVGASVRSIPGVDISELLEICQSSRPGLFLRYGGHTGAGGFAVRVEHLAEARTALEEVAAIHVPRETVGVILHIDAEVSLAQIDLHAVSQVERLAPFGAGFPEPLFLTRHVYLTERRLVGREGKHLQIRVRRGQAHVRGVLFNHDAPLTLVAESEPVDIVFSLGRDEWQGESYPKIYIRDWRRSEV